MVTDALGLGDVVFPSVLVAWGFAADDDIDVVNDVEPAILVCVDNSMSSVGEDIDDIDGNYSRGGLHHHPYGYVLGLFVTEIVGIFEMLGNRLGLLHLCS